MIAHSTFILLLLVSVPAFAGWHPLSTKLLTNENFRVEVLQTSESSTTLQFQLSGFETSEIKIKGVSHISVDVPGLTVTDQKGYPELPKINKNVVVPFNSQRATAEVLEVRYEEFKIGTVAPSKGAVLRNQNPEEVPYVFDDFYNQDSFYPSGLTEMSKIFQMRDIKGVNLSIRPFQFNPKTGVLKIAAKVVVKINTTRNGKGKQFLHAQKAIDADFQQLYRNMFINYEGLTRTLDAGHVIEDSGRLLVIYNPLFASALTPFVQWKQQRGFDVQLASTTETGSGYAEIKDYITKKYREKKITYVLLVGDAEFVAFHPGSAGNASKNEADPLYGTIEGDDNYPEIIISRFSVKDVRDVETIVNKIINYEKNPEINGQWYSKATAIASNEGSPTDWERAELLREKLEGWHYNSVDKLYDPGVQASTVAEALDEGRGFINYIGHGSKTSWGTSRFAVSDIKKLQNRNMTPFIVSVACVNGDFSGWGESFAERWLLAGSPEEAKGAVAIFASSTNQSWVPPTVGQMEITNLLTTEQMNTVGMLFVHGSIAVLEDASSSAAQTFQTWHIFGDGTTQVRTKAPEHLEDNIPAVLNVENGKVSFQLNGPALTVSLTQKGRLLGASRSGDNGNAAVELDVANVNNEDVVVTITGPDKVPLIKEVKLAI